ncbi:Sec23-binding domain of Sec16-domain-containing protein [Peziza echinospora]|nr:Sec23-binding domain of Sec16-domain-containing protein [Peziza echinospora]
MDGEEAGNHVAASPHPSSEHGTLPRIESELSVAEACHIEDINTGCEVHRHPSDMHLHSHNRQNEPHADIDEIIFEEDEGWAAFGPDDEGSTPLEMASTTRGRPRVTPISPVSLESPEPEEQEQEQSRAEEEDGEDQSDQRDPEDPKDEEEHNADQPQGGQGGHDADDAGVGDNADVEAEAAGSDEDAGSADISSASQHQQHDREQQPLPSQGPAPPPSPEESSPSRSTAAAVPPPPNRPPHPDAQHDHPGPAQSQPDDTATIGSPVPDFSKSASPPSPTDINWAFDDMAELLDHETGPLTRQEVIQYAEQQRALAPTPAETPAPPNVTSKPEPESSSEDEEEHGVAEDPLSPIHDHHNQADSAALFGDDEDLANDDTAIFNSIFAQAGANQPIASHDLTPETPAEEKKEDPVSRTHSPVPDEHTEEATLGEENDLITTAHDEHVEVPAVAEKDTVATTPPTEEEESNPSHTSDTGPSFFDEQGVYDDLDFFSLNKPQESHGQSAAETGLAQDAEPVVHYGGEAATKSAIAEIFAADDDLAEDADFFANPSQAQQPPAEATNNEATPSAEEIAAKWKAALADDELLDDEFLPEDGEGFLSSDDEGGEGSDGRPTEMLRPVLDSNGQLQGFSNVNIAGAPTSTIYSPHTTTTQNLQAPHPPSAPAYGVQNSGFQAQPVQFASGQPQVAPSPYAPTQASNYTPVGAYLPPVAQAPPRAFGGALKPAPPPPTSRAESFVDKKGGYQSPYDLPMDVIKPALAKRVSMPHMAPQRQSSTGVGLTPPMAQGAFAPPPTAPGYANRPVSSSGPPPTPSAPPAGKPPLPSTPKQAFFEELPIAKTRPTHKYAPPAQPGAYGMARSGSQPGQQPPRAVSASSAASPYQPPSAPSLGPAPSLTGRYAAPPAQNRAPYAPPPAQQYPVVPPTAINASNYAPTGPTIPQNQGLVSPPQAPSYNRSQTAPQQNAGYENKYPPPPSLQSSPPTQRQPNAANAFGADSGIDHQSVQHYSPNQLQHLHSSRPGTAKSSAFATGFGTLPEEDEAAAESGAPAAPPNFGNNRYGVRSTATPPPPSGPAMKRVGTFSPPTRSSSPGASSPYQPQYPVRTDSPEQLIPPRRARTQSPSTVMNGPNSRVASLYQAQKHVPRPASALAGNGYNGFSPVEQHARSLSAGVKNFMNDPANFMPPQDQSIHDPLNRWQGCPIFSWGFGGHVAVMFPTRTQRNSAGASQPMIKCSPGEVKIKNLKEILPLPETFVKFPGPIYSGGKGNKAKKKEVLTWMTDKIEKLEHEISDLRIPLPGEIITAEDKKRQEEKILLWKGMKTLLDNDGVLEGLEIEKSVRQFLWPDASPATVDAFGSINASPVDPISGPSSDRVDAEAMTTIRKHLLNGDRTSAVWHAVDRRLWSHAMLIAGTVSKDLWKQVVQDFVRNEVKTLGAGIESLAVLYEVFAGNGEESIDELVPQSARLGQPMMTNSFGSGVVSAKNPIEALDKWRETLALIISNRSAGDHSAIVALGKLLASYSRVEAAHLCYLFARSSLVFSGSDDPNTTVALFGADHVYSADSYWRDSDALLLSEIYELAVSLSPTALVPPIIPHLQGLKLYHAFTLAENGYRTEAHKYCEAIEAVLKTSTKPSPYFHRTLFNTLEDLGTRVSQSPKDAAAGGWLSKPSLDNISGSMWGVFSKFVAGEDNESVTSGAESGASGVTGLEPGQYGKMGTSPGMSRSQSSADMYGPYSAGIGGGNGMYSPAGAPKTGRYDAAPPTGGLYSPYAPKTPSYEAHNPYEPAHNVRQGYKPTPLQQQSQPSPYTPGAPTPYGGGYEPSPAQSTYNSPNPYKASFESPAPAQSTFEDSSSGYKPPSYDGGYAPPTDDYAPPTSNSSPVDEEEDSDDEKKKKQKKKGIMDDDDDDAEFLARAAALKKEQEEKKKKEEEEEKKKSGAAAGGGGWLRGWFGKKDPNAPSGPIKAKLGEESSFVYDPELKRWINKKAAPEEQSAPTKSAPPPKRPGPPSRPGSAAPQQHNNTSTPPPTKSASVPPSASSSTYPPPPSTPQSSAPPPRSSTPTTSTPATETTPSTPTTTSSAPPPRAGTPGTPSNAPPSRVGTPGTPGMSGPPPPPPVPSMSAPPPGRAAAPPPPKPSGDILDDLLGGGNAPPRKAGGAGAKKGRKGRYVDIMDKGGS